MGAEEAGGRPTSAPAAERIPRSPPPLGAPASSPAFSPRCSAPAGTTALPVKPSAFGSYAGMCSPQRAARCCGCILVGAILETHPEHVACLSALEDSQRPFTNDHVLAETFATLTGFYKVPTEAAAELTLGLRDSVEAEALALADYETSIREARTRGVMGGGISACDFCAPQKGSSDRDAKPLTFQHVLAAMLGYSTISSLFAEAYGILHCPITYSLSPGYIARLEFAQFHYADCRGLLRSVSSHG